jgi:hypothetical protein
MTKVISLKQIIGGLIRWHLGAAHTTSHVQHGSELSQYHSTAFDSSSMMMGLVFELYSSMRRINDRNPLRMARKAALCIELSCVKSGDQRCMKGRIFSNF